MSNYEDLKFKDIVVKGTEGITLPIGTTAQRVNTQGVLRFNSTTGVAEYYSGNEFLAIDQPPTISSVSPTSFDGSSGTSFTITGTNFKSGASVNFITTGGSKASAGSVTVTSSTSITATTGQNYTISDEPLGVEVVNASGFAADLLAQIDAGGSPTWSTSSGQIASDFEGESISVQLSASDPDGQTVNYSLASGSLPSGVTLSSTGLVSGTLPSVSSDTTFNFTVAASDGINSTSRSFSIQVLNGNFFGDGSDGSLST